MIPGFHNMLLRESLDLSTGFAHAPLPLRVFWWDQETILPSSLVLESDRSW